MSTVPERIRNIQRRLGLRADGIIGPVTLTRLEALLNRCLEDEPEAEEPEHSLVVSRRGLDLIVSHEIGSESYYRQRLENPVWPGGASGVTIGIGYDLGYNSPAQIERDWRGRLSDAELATLLRVAGLRGEDARRALGQVRGVTIPLEAAKEVFFTSTLPRFARMTRQAYPGIENLPADAQAALLSLIYNRGASKSGARRREMRAIEDLVQQRDLTGIAEQIRSMKRLWANTGLSGLLRRRDEEAELVEHAERDYAETELVKV